MAEIMSFLHRSGTSVPIAIPFTCTSQSDEAGNFTGNVALYDYNMESGGEYVVIAVDDNSDYARFLNIKDNGAWTTLDADGISIKLIIL